MEVEIYTHLFLSNSEGIWVQVPSLYGIQLLQTKQSGGWCHLCFRIMVLHCWTFPILWKKEDEKRIYFPNPFTITCITITPLTNYFHARAGQVKWQIEELAHLFSERAMCLWLESVWCLLKRCSRLHSALTAQTALNISTSSMWRHDFSL